ncbi:MAG: alanine dehydrogenase [Zetaproteobacteria bacterium CG_4_9_14_3_um_filter_49_83]|nr:MAG: alanine dehydrogenase [Zetaproteobacteria bacterium CG1_02_49_23]PIQ33543.1 MAG: alanine dehydrogenase [Zetaproteobacteria bacterium CG17_big_fil_post_rev_8_21_14_2_50_50_13]PIV29587.1 MAG: alanine dehydrogenase [Zetaproteobacteria bacterium CG02_land_8_20_14_3_00_50_9]PIY56371.1 MAG: alanine dehydrogenase [Zetaproteobacteria bacterium CG_4_10_14_0_8_um_filter_49_80]PJA34768.1 MAG: alanine dehydrogenase [Zetaproteobacteria bacterium CG_4_9_14_3_um_filter_49_83]
MRIGIPKEIKNGEHRVALTPQGVAALVAGGHRLLVQAGAGEDSGYSDALYRQAGAELIQNPEAAWNVDLVVKVKEPLPQEYAYLKAETGLFTFLHLAAFPELTRRLLDAGVRSIGYETVELEPGGLPILAPMSKVAGRVAMLMAARFLQFGSFHGQPLAGVRHKGMLMGGIQGVEACRVVILGGGNVGRHAAHVATGLDAQVLILDHNEACISYLNSLFDGKAEARSYAESDLGPILAAADVVIGAALIPGEHAPQLITRQMITAMQNGSVFVDVAIDQGGVSQTSRVTSYDEPVYAVDGVIHSCLPNLPASVPRSSTQALVAASLPYLTWLADEGIEAAVINHAELQRGVNTWDGEILHHGVRKAFPELI